MKLGKLPFLLPALTLLAGCPGDDTPATTDGDSTAGTDADDDDDVDPTTPSTTTPSDTDVVETSDTGVVETSVTTDTGDTGKATSTTDYTGTTDYTSSTTENGTTTGETGDTGTTTGDTGDTGTTAGDTGTTAGDTGTTTGDTGTTTGDTGTTTGDTGTTTGDTGTETTGGGTCPDQDAMTNTGLDVATGTTTGATDDFALSCGGGGGEDVSVAWEAPNDGDYAVSLVGSDYDTALGIFGACDGPEDSCNDDMNNSFTLSNGGISAFNLCGVSAGDSFVFAVDGFTNGGGETSTGNFELNILERVDGLNCCNNTSGAGCEIADIETCTCDHDDFCCTDDWDAQCITIAEAACGADCGSCSNP